MSALEADFSKAVATLVQVEKDLRSADQQARIELATMHREVSVERGLTRDLVAAVDRRMDEYERESERRHKELLKAIAALRVPA